ncbi:helix-turn-helix transcriptional regulator [Catellatospora tritici]|uniref:helix-turn-helix transcriptional regulator n=1 Tax=Catellatospora tritici TaxID=2851566 RepID=UPI001C2D0B45|nr:helix-turn-helix transcriptional regulator [Catellatospora tritici]MBV1852223.1 helix-turn-helix transcriptional regulator [Catellatospora tritici]
MNREAFAEFVRSRRARLRPAEVGLSDSGTRRTPGLRRQEVAQLAGISIEYYIRLEQARGPHPSWQVLSALGRALLLNADERAHLFQLAGVLPQQQDGPSRDVPDGIRHLLIALTKVPAYVLNAKYDILAWNEMASRLLMGGPVAGLKAIPPGRRNVVRWTFRSPNLRRHLADEQAARFARFSVADLRAARARYPGDRGIRDLVDELLRTSPEFGEIWSEHEVESHRTMTKRMEYPIAGPLELECQVLLVPDRDQRLVVYTAAPGSSSAQALRALATVDQPQW